jgi:hypothetical protein
MINKKALLRLWKTLGALDPGVLEYWSIEVLERHPTTIHYSNTPVLQSDEENIFV